MQVIAVICALLIRPLFTIRCQLQELRDSASLGLARHLHCRVTKRAVTMTQLLNFVLASLAKLPLQMVVAILLPSLANLVNNAHRGIGIKMVKDWYIV